VQTKVRIMPTLLFKEVGLVKGERFDSWRRVGSAQQAIKVYNLRQVDELVFLDIVATLHNHPPDFQLIDELADSCFMPLTVGGGIQSPEHVRRLLEVGADKVAINTAIVDNPSVIEETARHFGSQCVVVSIDVRQHADHTYEAFVRSGTTATGIHPVELARRAEALGAGEILLTSIDRDGTMTGYDLPLIRQVADSVSIPVIASGGAGTYAHLAEALTEGRASAVAAASMFTFTEQTPLEAKHYLASRGFRVRQ
jgi:cyclase